MSNFKEKIRAGLESAKVARESNAEIDAVFESLADDLVAMGMPVKIKFTDVGFLEKMQLPVGTPGYSRKNLVLSNDTTLYALGYFARSENGYPCAIVIGNDVMTANDRLSLEAVLGDVFATSRVGRILHNLNIDFNKTE